MTGLQSKPSRVAKRTAKEEEKSPGKDQKQSSPRTAGKHTVQGGYYQATPRTLPLVHLEEPVPSWDFALCSSAPSEIPEIRMAVPFQFRKSSRVVISLGTREGSKSLRSGGGGVVLAKAHELNLMPVTLSFLF